MTPLPADRIPPPEVVATRLKSPLLRRLLLGHAAQLAPMLEPRVYPRGELVCRLGERPPGTWILLEGEVSISRRANDVDLPGTEARGAGSTFGWDGGPTPPDTAVRAETPLLTLFVAESRIAPLAAGGGPVAELLGFYADLSARRAEVVRALRMAVCFRGLSRRRILALVERLDRHDFAPGEVALTQGAPPTGIFVVLEGELHAIRREAGGDEVLVDVLTPGEVFGDVATYTGAPEALTVHAVRHTSVAWLPIDAYLSMVAASPAFRRRLGAQAMSRILAAGLEDPEAVVLVGPDDQRAARSALTRLVAASLAREHRSRVLLLHLGRPTGDAPRPGPVPGVDELVVPATVEDLLHATQRWRGRYDPIFLLPPPRAELERLAPALGRLVHVTEDPFAPLDSAALSTIPLRTCALIGAGGSRAGYPARTVRLRATPATLARLEHTPLGDVPPEVGRGVARLGRAITERLVGLALGGGGAWGFAHLALLRALHDGEDDVPIDMVAGASFGALVAGFYCAQGLPGLDLLVRNGRRAMPYTQLSMISSRAFQSWVDRELGAPRMEDLEIPMFPVATDTAAGAEFVPRTGTVGYGVRASGAMPPLFTPVLVGGSRMVDGGFVNNVPASLLRNEGASFVIASNVVARAGDDRDRAPTGRVARFLRAFDPLARAEDVLRSSLVLFHTTGLRESMTADGVFLSSFGSLAFWDFGSGAEVVGRTVADPGFQPQIRRIKDRWAAFATELPAER